MSITNELRNYVSGPAKSGISHICENAILHIADRIDAKHQKACDDAWDNGYEADYLGIESWLTEHPQVMEKHGWICLPKDADGEVIHIGDMMERGKARGHVIALMLSEYPEKWGGELHWGVQLEGEQAPTALDLTFHHYHEPTVEDVLREFAEKVIDSQIPSVHPTYEEAIEEYAAKLRLGDGKEQQ